MHTCMHTGKHADITTNSKGDMPTQMLSTIPCNMGTYKQTTYRQREAAQEQRTHQDSEALTPSHAYVFLPVYVGPAPCMR